MSGVQIQFANFLLPSGKELKLSDVLRFCYGLSETEIQILMTLLKSRPKTTQELKQELQVSKASVSRSLNKLLNLGLIKRTKGAEKKYGRPKYIYYVPDFNEFKEKLTKEIEECTNDIRNLMINWGV